MLFWTRHPDIGHLTETGEIPALIRLLAHREPSVQWNAAEALGRMGHQATPFLISALEHRNVDIRLGTIEALGDSQDSTAVQPLIDLLEVEDNEEVRWAIVLTLGQIGDPKSTDALVESLSDPSKYVRYGAALSLEKIGWIFRDTSEKTQYLIARQLWEQIPSAGEAALEPLIRTISDEDSRIRARAVELLGMLKNPRAEEACDRALADPSGEVRWKALLAFPGCGLPLAHLTHGLARRPRTGQSPMIAAFLNLLFPGIGYNYLGKWYGFLLFQINLAAVVLLSLMLGPILPYLLSYSFGSLVSIHAWKMAKSLPDLP